jgi:hypothetical protein
MSEVAEKKYIPSFRALERAKLNKVVEVIPSMKQTAMIVEVECEANLIECLYRPEKGIRLSLDPRVPKPQELTRDVAYHRLDRFLGWNLSLPVVFWSLEQGDRGVLRPYIRKVEKMEIFHFTKERLRGKNQDFWLKAAVLDYVCGVVDRGSNDVLIVGGQPRLIDSGLSFVPYENFPVQQSLIRERLKGERLEERILADLERLDLKGIASATIKLIDEELLTWVVRRASLTLEKRRVI